MTTADRSPFPASSYPHLARAEVKHWWFKMRNQILIWTLSNKVKSFDNLLEIGCGTGYVLEGISRVWPEVELHGSEYFDEGLEYARQRLPGGIFGQLDARQLDEVGKYDVIGAFDVLEHIEEDETVLKNLARAIRPGGSLVITVPQHSWLWSSVDEYASHVRRYSRAELVAKVQKAGLKIGYINSFVSLLLPLMWMSRKRSRKNECMSEFNIPRWLNFSLEVVMKAEFLLLRAGVVFPAGGSLLLVATKSNQCMGFQDEQ